MLRVRYGNENYNVGAEQLLLLRKNILVEYQPCMGVAGEDQPLEFIQFTIKAELVKEFTKMASLNIACSQAPAPLVIKPGERDCIAYMQSLDTMLADEGRPADGLVKIKMLELLFHLSGTDRNIFEQLLDVREHYRTNITATVEENITNSMSVEQLAVLSGRSLSSFRRDFMAIYNMPPSQWIRLKRLEKAKELLLSTTMTITDICYTLGFENIAHFSRLFKAHCGYPPSCYKSNSKAA
ncbi:MAG TPA: AraC family transcriptional regulator [Chitinophagaceae bacterium]|nr:AraC family transcriptional regulator [Chitinophagaceae bacterium]